MKKTKRILAIVGIIFLGSLYLSAFMFAFVDTTASLFFFKTSIAGTIFFPVILYIISLLYKLGGNNQDSSSDEDSTGSNE